MLKTAMISAAALLLASIAAPASNATPNRIENLTSTKVQDEYEACLLLAGCIYVTEGGGDTDPGYWTCPYPQIYMNCLAPADPVVP
ncbi:MAG: hypothetical protein ACK4UQ_00545 [Brevundimonas sp.]